MKRQRGVCSSICRISGAILVALGLLGCASTGTDSRSNWTGPTVVQPIQTKPWQYRQLPGKTLLTKHYAIHTTIDDEQFLDRLPQVLEGAHEQYEKLAPGLPSSDRQMDCYLFSRRPEWVMFTRDNTPKEDAPTYLRINRGGYTRGDWYVAYFIGDAGTYSVSAHE